MSAVPLRKAAQEADCPPEAADLDQRAEARGRATSVPKLLSSVPEGSPEGSVPGHVPSLPERLAGFRPSMPAVSPLRASPPSVAEVWASHRESASRHQAGLIAWPRHAWGAAHTVVVALSYGVLWVAFSPAGFIVAVACLVACWAWL